MRQIGYIGIIVLGLNMIGCASYFLRKECEKTNWFEYGHKVAMSGRRLDADGFVKKCEKVEAEISHGDLDVGFKSGMAKYCEPETVYKEGKKGRFFSYDMCDESRKKLLKQRHEAGVLQFCQKENGKRFGSTGKKYNDICPSQLESAFLVEYRKGRKVYLRAKISEKEREIRDIHEEINRQEHKKRQLARDLTFLPKAKKVTRKKVTNRLGSSEEVVVQEADETKRRRQDLQNQIYGVDGKISRLQRKKTEVQKQIREFGVELRSL